MQTTLASLLAILATAPAWTSAADCTIPQCPDGWSASACNTGSPDFCCPGASQINRTGASCCIGGDVFSHTCEGGTLIPVGDGGAAYTSSVMSAMSSATGKGPSSAGKPTTTAAPSAVTTTDASGNKVTSTQPAAASSTTPNAAPAATGLSGAVMGLAAGIAVILV